MIEIILYAVNGWICQRHLHVVDEGGSILIHFYGAIFGLAVSRAVNRSVKGQSHRPPVCKAVHKSVLPIVALWFKPR